MKAICRAIAFGFAVLAFVLLVVDGTTSIAGGGISVTRVSDLVVRFGDMQTLQRWQAAVSARLHPGAWRVIEVALLPLPAVVVALGAMAAFWRLGLREAPDFDLRPRDRRG